MHILIHTFVTLVPARKNTIRSAKGRLHGWTACAAAVKAAATIPAGVSDLCDQARTTIARVTGTAIIAFILIEKMEVERWIELLKAKTPLK